MDFISKQQNEFEFINQLTNRIKHKFPDYSVDYEMIFDRLRPDIYINKHNNEQNIIIEIKKFRTENYSSLPFSTIIQLEDYKKHFDDHRIILITFVKINKLMEHKLKELNIEVIINPNTFTEITEKI
ncbi:hypothetical protein [Flavobacterium anhuiense]|uniref:hypothetical protein n=1 Tax=Flavobacterium anhuiense TaxID=459526 RepID=UPI0034D97893